MRDKLQSNLKYALLGAIGFILLGYTLYEARFLIGGPKLNIFYPKNNSTFTDPLLELKGSAQNLSKLTVNGRQIMITPDGSFTDKLLLQDGYNTIEVKASNKFGQENQKIINIVLTPKT